jgi:hypothetical protein
MDARLKRRFQIGVRINRVARGAKESDGSLPFRRQEMTQKVLTDIGEQLMAQWQREPVRLAR